MSTLRLLIPDWQGGNKPAYYFGAKMLDALVPKNAAQEQVEIAVKKPTTAVTQENGVNSQSDVLAHVEQTAKVLAEKQPDKVITLGGTCLVSQAPFDYLQGKYQEKLGILWIDSHPDVSTPQDYFNEHAMVLGNLLHAGDKRLAAQVKHPLDPKNILYVGLQKMNDYEYERLDQLGIKYQEQPDKPLAVADIQAWIEQNGFTKLAIHFDLDVLSPADFHSLYFAEPGIEDFGAQAGKLSFAQVSEILTEISAKNEIVGFSIAEYLPWDALRLHQLFSKLAIFKNNN
ncbi:arginase family protein [Ligilactobacillus animalis]|uniref:arginase family protein n=1 Tax=Ligilactobacillus animalis TaxID=1605 RepID=UPI002597467D|nr:arginase family protein [Ligilactobacillus animalis]